MPDRRVGSSRWTLDTYVRGGENRRVHIDRYDFGLLVLDGRQLRADVLMTSEGLQDEHCTH